MADRVVEQVEEASGHAERRSQADPEDDITDLADRGIGQHPLHVRLAEGQEGGDDDRHGRQPHQDLGQGRRHPEDVEEDPGDGVDARDLDQQARKNRRDRGRGRRMGVGKPGVEGNQGGLQPEAHEEQGGARRRRRRWRPAAGGRRATASKPRAPVIP